jgi:hypothetical protein
MHRSFSKAAGLIATVFGIMVAGCSPQGADNLLPEKTADDIPWGSNLVVVNSEKPPDTLFKALQQELKSRDFLIKQKDAAQRTVLTKPNFVGERVMLIADGAVKESAGGSTLVLRGMVAGENTMEVGRISDIGEETGEGEQRATWYRDGTQPRGYAVLVQIAQSLPGTVKYDEE